MSIISTKVDQISEEVVSATSYVQFAGRTGLAAIFILSGISKLSSADATIGYIASVGLPLPELAFAAAVLVELFGGLALVLGYRTRLVAAFLALFSLVTAILFHADLGDQNQFIHFFKNIAIAGGLAQIMVSGAGRVSLDSLR
jgi:putative oxidoreductase